MVREITLPEISESVESGEVIQVLVTVGQLIQVEEAIVELETEKATFEVPAPAAGMVTEINIEAGQKVNVGQVLMKIDTDIISEEQKPAIVSKIEEEAEPVIEEEKEEVIKPPAVTEANAAPTVRQLARELGIEISKVTPGEAGRISLDDVKNYARSLIASKGAPIATGEGIRPLPDFSKWGEIERKPITAIRRKTGENVTYAWKHVPHVTQHEKADITELEEFRKEYKNKVEQAGGKLTVTSILMKVVASALMEFSQFNASFDEEKGEIIYKKYCNICVAVDTDQGLVVPVVRDVDKKNILQISAEVSELADRARNKKNTPRELSGGNFTISNLGGIGGTGFTPVIYWPQVAILGVSQSRNEPVYIEGQLQSRIMLPLSLSYDHRVIDGADGIRFLKYIVEELEKPFLLAMEE
jgi:pyruvate dehydrogenase E2 component (dihydrolipoamide acetyltransferase)